MVPQQVTPARDCGMSLSAGQVPEEGQHSPETGGKSLSQKPPHLYVFSLRSRQDRITRGNCCQERFGSPGAQRIPRTSVWLVPRCPRAEVQVPSSGTRGPVGTDGRPQLPASEPCPAHRPRTALPSRSPVFSTETPHSPLSPPCVPSTPDLHLSSFSRCPTSPLSRTSCLSSPPDLGCGHPPWGHLPSTEHWAPRAGTAMPLKDSSPPRLTKQGMALVWGCLPCSHS